MFNTVESSRKDRQTETLRIIGWKLIVSILRLLITKHKYFNNFGEIWFLFKEFFRQIGKFKSSNISLFHFREIQFPPAENKQQYDVWLTEPEANTKALSTLCRRILKMEL